MLLKYVRNVTSTLGLNMYCTLLPLEGCSALTHNIAMAVRGEVCVTTARECVECCLSVPAVYWLLGLWSDHVIPHCYIIY